MTRLVSWSMSCEPLLLQPDHNGPEQLLSAPCFPLSVEEEDEHGTGENRGEAENGDTFFGLANKL